MAGAHAPGSRHQSRVPVGVVPGHDQPSRSDSRLVAWCLAGLLAAGAAVGLTNLFVEGVLREGASRPVYVAALGAAVLTAGYLVWRQRVSPAATAGLVALGDVLYVVIGWSTTDPLRYASPIGLLFTCFVAAWFLGPRVLAVQMVAVVGACWLVLADNYDVAGQLAVQVAVNAGTLDGAMVGIFLLRRRVEALLAATLTLSSTDPLTGLANRRSLVEQAPRIWKQARRDGQRVAALVLDLDHFKQLNDAHGHAVGDAVLRAVADSLSATVRPADVLARTGGEELVVLGLVADPAEARHLAERLRLAVSGSSTGREHRVTVSIGAALTRPADGDQPADELWRLVDRADVAMYAAKQDGRNRVRLAAPGVVVPAPRQASRPTRSAGPAGGAA
ncbi:GGDEF domain-containing protein [Modestobacter marinus]|uniref:GGDEF domain-containing protein n=1 Tax=Modestobacter marinus TaxID=477641 RepID=UPI001C93E3D2|nr:GGDEF domain-containing protein [Modestobacter marinus]